MLVRFDFLARSFFAHCSDAEADFLLFLVHLYDLELILLAGLQVELSSMFINRLRVMAQTFDSVGDFDKRSEGSHSQNLSMDHIAHSVLNEERLPYVGLELLDSQGQPTLV